MSKKAMITIGIGIGVIAAVGITAAIIYKNRSKVDDSNLEVLFADTDEKEADTIVCFNHAISTTLTFDEARDIATVAAKEKLGDFAFVVPASEGNALFVNIENKKRACYMFGVGDTDENDGVLTGIYHVDADTGEVFDNSKGTMEKIR